MRLVALILFGAVGFVGGFYVTGFVVTVLGGLSPEMVTVFALAGGVVGAWLTPMLVLTERGRV